MNADCAMLLTSLEPIVAGWARMEYHADGWELVMGHRHFAGRMGECPAESYLNLTLAELLDVLEVVVGGWGPFGGSLNASESAE